MTYSESIQFLYELRWFGVKLGLTNALRLAEFAGKPQDQLRFIHVAGTNGKGSTCAMLESIYRVAGLRVGLFTSPHLVTFGERIQVNRQAISESETVRLVTEMQTLLRQFPAEEHPTFFEVVAVMALLYFAQEKCDLVIWETGLGGRLDATNIVMPLASVITNVHYDHQNWLGQTLASIAGEKAGIIKRGVPVITATEEPEAFAVIEQTAKNQRAPLTRVCGSAVRQPLLGELELPLPGQHQKLNAALAIATVRALNAVIPVSQDRMKKGLSSVNWAGRLQTLARPNGNQVLLDGAHNVGGAEALKRAWVEDLRLHEPALVLGMLDDKDWGAVCGLLAPLAPRIFLVPVSNQRTASPEQLQQACQAAHPGAEIVPCTSAAEALERTAMETVTVVTGSLYLVGEALGLLQPSAHDERLLNEWYPQGKL